MKASTFKKALAVVAVVVCVGMLTGCASVTWNSSFTETALAGDATKMVEASGGKEVGKYTSIFGMFPLGYNTYAGLISAELRKGNRSYHHVTKNYFFWSQTVGYIQEH